MIGHQFELGHVMAGDDDGTVIRNVILDEVAHPLDAFRVEAVQGFVQDEIRGVGQDRGRDAQTLFHAKRIGLERPSARLVQSHEPQAFVASGERNAGDQCNPTEMAESRPGRMRRQPVDERADDIARRWPQFVVSAAIERGRAATGRLQPEQDVQQRRLSGTVRTD